MLGVDWCIVHQVPLRNVQASDPYETSPEHWLRSSKVSSVVCAGARFISDVRVQRYALISAQLLQQVAPVHRGALYRLIRAKADHLGARVNKAGEVWLREECEALDARWRPKGLDNLLRSRQFITSGRGNALPGSVYAIILALVCETPEDAMEMVAGAQSPSASEETTGGSRRARGDDYWFGPIWWSFLASDGNVSELRRHIGGAKSNLVVKLRAAGLTSLCGLNTRPCWDALLKFSEGASIAAACHQTGAAREDLERLLRIGGTRLALAVRHVRSKGDSAKNSSMP